MELLLDLAHNISLLLALTVAYDAIAGRRERSGPQYRLFSALLFAGVALVGMMTPVRFASGVIYDGRSIVLFVAGYFGGPLVAGLAAVGAAAYRVWLGGAGTLAGVIVIVEATAIGVLGYRLRRKNEAWSRTPRILLLALGVHLIMIAAQLLLPRVVVREMMRSIAPAVITIYPAAATILLRIMIDHQAQRETRRRLAESEERYRNLFENSYAPMMLLDPENGAILDANGVAAEFYGWSVDEMRSMSISQINTMPPERIRSAIASAQQREKNYFEFQHRLRNGTVRDVAIYSGTVTLGGRRRLYSIIRDITGERRMEREIRLLSHALEHAAVGVYRISRPDGVIEYANERACADLGYARDELLGRSVFEIDAGMDAEKWHASGQELERTGRHATESLLKRKDGSLFPVIVTASSFRYGDEEHTVSFVTDISRRRETEVELERSLHQKGALLREVHHRVKNNLAIMSSLVHLQLREGTSGTAESSALRKTGDRIVVMGLIHNLLYQEDDITCLDGASLLKQVASHLSARYADSGRVRTTMRLDPVSLDVDLALPLAIIASEAITNAYTHAFPGDAAGRVTLALSSLGEGRHQLQIADDGPGLPARMVTDRPDSLGLSLMHILARQIDASLRVDGADGTRITLEFCSTNHAAASPAMEA